MKRKLSINGNSWTLYINKPFANAIGVCVEERSVNLNFVNKTLYISKATTKDKLNTKTLIKRGASYGLVLALPVLELLNIDPEKDFVDIDINESTLIIKKYNES